MHKKMLALISYHDNVELIKKQAWHLLGNVISTLLQQAANSWPVTQYNQFKSKKAASYSDLKTAEPTIILVANNQFYHTMTWVTRKGLDYNKRTI